MLLTNKHICLIYLSSTFNVTAHDCAFFCVLSNDKEHTYLVYFSSIPQITQKHYSFIHNSATSFKELEQLAL